MMEPHLHAPYVFMVWCLIAHKDNFTYPRILMHGAVRARQHGKKWLDDELGRDI
jgi:hypothetical protein